MSDIAKELEKIAKQLGVDPKRTVIQAAKELGVKSRVIKNLEGLFPQLKPALVEDEKPRYLNKDLEAFKKVQNFLSASQLEAEELREICDERSLSLEEILEKNPQEFLSKQIGIEDFIIDENPQPAEGLPQPETWQGSVNPKDKLINFFDLKIGEIAPKKREELKDCINQIRQKLKFIKSNLESY